MGREKKERVLWIDCAKAVAIILVVIGHMSSNTYVFKWIYSFHMPFFFFIGGYTLKPDKQVADFFRGKLKTLIFPYLICSVIWYGVYKGIYYIFIGNSSIISFLIDLKNAEAALIKGNYNDLQYFNSVLWFIPCFFASETTLFLIAKVVRYKKEVLLISFFLTTATNLGLMPWIGTWHISESWAFLIWMALGYCASDFILKMSGEIPSKVLILMTITGFSVLSVLVGNIESVDKARCPLSPLGIISLIALSIVISRAIENKGLTLFGGITQLSKAAMLILLTHSYFVDEVHRRLPWVSSNVIVSIMVSVSFVICASMCGFLLNYGKKIVCLKAIKKR